MSDLVVVRDSQAAHSPKERWGDHTGAQTNLTEQTRAQQKRTHDFTDTPSKDV